MAGGSLQWPRIPAWQSHRPSLSHFELSECAPDSLTSPVPNGGFAACCFEAAPAFHIVWSRMLQHRTPPAMFPLHLNDNAGQNVSVRTHRATILDIRRMSRGLKPANCRELSYVPVWAGPPIHTFRRRVHESQYSFETAHQFGDFVLRPCGVVSRSTNARTIQWQSIQIPGTKMK